MGRALAPAGALSHPLSNRQDRHPRIEPVHGLRDDAPRSPRLEQVIRRRLLLAPELNELVQRQSDRLGVMLEEAIEAKQRVLAGVVAIAERAHMRHVLFHYSSEEASEAQKPPQLLQFRVTVFANQGAHDRRRARAVSPMQLRKGVRCNHPLAFKPVEISFDERSPVIKDVCRPFQAAFLQPVPDYRYGRWSA